MHQDQRVGLAFGVLLVGACAAFFFRNEAPSTTQTPQLQNAQALDDRIAERANRPYLRGIQVVETADQRSKSSVDPAHALEDQDGAFDQRRDSLASSKRFVKPGSKSSDGSSDILELSPIRIPSDSSLENPIQAVPDPQAVRNPAKPADEVRTYVVQRGDTLSSIASRTLGNSSRFQELFDANQDQLRDPNDVKVGMTLRIPDGRAETASKSHSTKPQGATMREPETFSAPVEPERDFTPPSLESSSPSYEKRHDSPEIMLPPDIPGSNKFDPPTTNDSPDDGTGPKLFVPARRVPLPGRPAGPQANANGPRELSGRKLSQATLQSTSGKVAR